MSALPTQSILYMRCSIMCGTNIYICIAVWGFHYCVVLTNAGIGHLVARSFSRLLGWWSHDRESRLAMPPGTTIFFYPKCHYLSIPLDLSQVLGARGFHVSNPPILQCMLVKGSLNVFSETSMRQLCQKSRLLTGYLEMLIERNFFQGKTSDTGG